MFGAVGAMFTLPSMCNSTKNLTADPIAELIKTYKERKHFTVLLYDMDVEGTFSKDYKQRYRILYDSAETVSVRLSPWFAVSSAYYSQQENNVGMEVAAKSYQDGMVRRIIGPPGYTNYIGNRQYGYWSNGQPQEIIYTETLDTQYQNRNLREVPLVEETVISSDGQALVHFRRIDRAMLNDLADTIHIKIERQYPMQQEINSMDYWVFYPGYANLKTLLQLPSGKINHNNHQQARSYYNRGYAYYGILLTTGYRRYGTYSTTARSYSRGRRYTRSRTYSRGGGGHGK